MISMSSIFMCNSKQENNTILHNSCWSTRIHSIIDNLGFTHTRLNFDSNISYLPLFKTRLRVQFVRNSANVGFTQLTRVYKQTSTVIASKRITVYNRVTIVNDIII